MYLIWRVIAAGLVMGDLNKILFMLNHLCLTYRLMIKSID